MVGCQAGEGVTAACWGQQTGVLSAGGGGRVVGEQSWPWATGGVGG